MSSGSKKYGLQLRGPLAAARKPPPLKKPSIFDDEDEDDVEQAIARQALKNRALKEVEQQHKSALEQDPTVFDYDGVYDEMKSKSARAVNEDPNRNKPKYITKLIEKAKFRQQEQDIVYERKLAKERALEDHLYDDKEKFVTGAYKKKLAEQAKWLEEERLRDLREQAEEVTKKGDLSGFYRNLLSKNISFGRGAAESKEESTASQKVPHSLQDEPSETVDAITNSRDVDIERESKQDTKAHALPKEAELPLRNMGAHALLEEAELPLRNMGAEDADKRHGLQLKAVSVPECGPNKGSESPKSIVEGNQEVMGKDKHPAIGKSEVEFNKPLVLPSEHKPTKDDVAAAKARYLARKRMRES